jgi:methionyl-tRNA formyltransferase
MIESSANARKTYLVLGCKPWNRRAFDAELARLPGEWAYIGAPEGLAAEAVQQLAPRYIFVLHWSWKVPPEIYENFECVCFHMTDVPFGRGGSPLQNLIARGHRETRLTALRMVHEFDAGPVYLKEPLTLEGSAEEIYLRATALAVRMVQRMVREQPVPAAQQGEVVTFKRRKPEESAIAAPESLTALYDFIRMLDADGYPHAFLDHSGFRFEFTRAALYDGRIVADVKITATPASKENKA